MKRRIKRWKPKRGMVKLQAELIALQDKMRAASLHNPPLWASAIALGRIITNQTWCKR